MNNEEKRLDLDGQNIIFKELMNHEDFGEQNVLFEEILTNKNKHLGD